MPWAASFVSEGMRGETHCYKEIYSRETAAFPGKNLSSNTVMIATAEKTTDGEGGSGKVAEK